MFYNIQTCKLYLLQLYTPPTPKSLQSSLMPNWTIQIKYTLEVQTPPGRSKIVKKKLAFDLWLKYPNPTDPPAVLWV